MSGRQDTRNKCPGQTLCDLSFWQLLTARKSNNSKAINLRFLLCSFFSLNCVIFSSLCQLQHPHFLNLSSVLLFEWALSLTAYPCFVKVWVNPSSIPVCLSVCLSVCLCALVYLFAVHMYISMWMYICVDGWMDVRTYVRTYICNVYMYVCMYVCMYVFACLPACLLVLSLLLLLLLLLFCCLLLFLWLEHKSVFSELVNCFIHLVIHLLAEHSHLTHRCLILMLIVRAKSWNCTSSV